MRIKAMTDIEVQERQTGHDGAEFSPVNIGVAATWPAPTFVGNLAADIVRIADGVLVEHWDVLQDEATREESQSGWPMFGTEFAP
jgi:predicted SnoaL-like aldol condensation-catalyzing enzyme